MGIVGMLGGLLFLVGWIWLIVIAFKTEGALWGIINIFFQPLTGLIFCLLKKVGWMQWGMMILGCVLLGFGGGLAAMSSLR